MNLLLSYHLLLRTDVNRERKNIGEPSSVFGIEMQVFFLFEEVMDKL